MFSANRQQVLFFNKCCLKFEDIPHPFPYPLLLHLSPCHQLDSSTVLLSYKVTTSFNCGL